MSQQRPEVRARVFQRFDVVGLLVGLLAAWASLSPTLLPRTWYFQGAVTGVALVVGYGVGSLVAGAVRRVLLRRGPAQWWSPRTALVLRRLALLGIVAGGGWVLVVAAREHSWTWRRLGYEPTSWTWAYVGIVLLAGGTAGLVLVVARLIVVLWRLLHRAGRLVLPSWLAALAAAVLVPWLLVVTLDTQVYERVIDTANEGFALVDQVVDTTEQPPPTSPYVSGGPASAQPWSTLGSEGRTWVARAPDAAELAAVAPEGQDVTAPVRAFIGRHASAEPDERAQLAVAELERLGGFERSAVLVVMPTGTGWVNEQVVRPLEHLLSGDLATVATQYSHMPSPLAFVAERAGAKESARELVSAVRARLDELPAAARPRLYVAGESLGAFALDGAFADLDALTSEVDGAVLVGTPSMSELRGEAERERRPGSPQVRPVVGDGEDIVFANRSRDLRELLVDEDRAGPRAVFLQQPDDGVVWWDPRTAFTRPDWLAEPLAREVNPALEWRPLVTFLNLTVDMVVSNDFDEGAGHRYGQMPAGAWRAIIRPGWDSDAVRRLHLTLQAVGR